MKRDARIGLAVVLVLGLGVTLLVGKAIYKRGGNANDLEGEVADAGSSDSNAANASAAGKSSLPDTFVNLPSQTPAFESPIPASAPVVQPEHPEAPPAGHDDTQMPSVKYFSYTVVNGDSPWIVSSKIFGDGKYTQKIMDANNLKTQKMKPGMTLKIPAVAAFKMHLSTYEAGRHEPTSPAPAATTTQASKTSDTAGAKHYKIENGDTLAVIAKKHYGNSGPKTIQMIVAANHGLNPAKLKVGQEITLPASK